VAIDGSIIDLTGQTIITGALTVTGGIDGEIYPNTNWSTGASNDGVFIQDSYTAGNRWKIYFNGNTHKLTVYQHGSTNWYAVTLTNP
jgi:hypothetical protein